MKKRVLVLGGTGAMGIYLVPYLAEMGYAVTVVSLDDCEDKPGIRYLKGNAKDLDFLEELLAQHFDATAKILACSNRSVNTSGVCPWANRSGVSCTISLLRKMCIRDRGHTTRDLQHHYNHVHNAGRQCDECGV